MTATVEDMLVGVGSPDWAIGTGAVLPDAMAARIEALEAEGRTVAVVTADAVVLGLITLRDEPRADAAAGIAALTALAVQSVTAAAARRAKRSVWLFGAATPGQRLPADSSSSASTAPRYGPWRVPGSR